jgi:hypothetical protein
MKRFAQCVCVVVLIVCCLYTIGELAFGVVRIQPQLFFPIVVLCATLFALRYPVPQWALWIAICLNAIFGISGAIIIATANPPFWWIVLIGFGAMVGPAVLNIFIFSRELKVTGEPSRAS